LVVIGNFDGVHRGHQAVLRAASQEAQARGLSLLVLTFDPHPAEVLGRASRSVLTHTERKVRLLEAVVPGLAVYVKRFDLQLAGYSPEQFAKLILRDELGAKVVLVGENFRFGKGRAGDLATLGRWGKELGFDAWAETLLGDEEGAFSSTRIRALLAAGDVRGAAEMLGRPHLLSGRVTRGDQRGRTLGFPTANLTGVQETLPREGVYAVHVYEITEETIQPLAPGVANLGARPTVERPATIEVHLLDFEEDLYDRTLAITLVDFLRPVEKFDDVLGLQAQIARDAEQARQTVANPLPALPI
jgi:riboflavin kinase/FMN adenylyltransferase